MIITDNRTGRVIKRHRAPFSGGKPARRMVRKAWAGRPMSERRASHVKMREQVKATGKGFAPAGKTTMR